MSDLLQQASGWLEEKRTAYASHVVTYVRGDKSVALSATVGKTTFEIDDGYGVLVRHESRDFLILVDELILDGKKSLPERGDRIGELQGGKTVIYEITAPGREPCWRYSDPWRMTLRIHTQQIM
jgi:hypothetical protein